MRKFRCVVLLLTAAAFAAPSAAQGRRPVAPQPVTGIHGAVTTQGGSVYLPGVVVSVLDPASGATVAETTSDGAGEYRIELNPGVYGVRARLDGFADAVRGSVEIVAGHDSEQSFDLDIARVAEEVTVEGAGHHELPLEAASTLKTRSGSSLEVGPIVGDNFQALLPTLPGVLRGPDGHISISGASATQSSVQINAANVTDPSTGTLGFDLPNDAVESVDVLTNPYAAEFGRFSSGVTSLNTTKGGSRWTFTPNGFIPRFYRADDNWWNILGFRSFRPRLAIGGPLKKDQAFLFSNILYRYIRNPIPDVPDDQNARYHEWKIFTRVDANISPVNLFDVSVAVFPQKVDYATLNYFNRLPVSTDFQQSGFNVAATDRLTLRNDRLLESTLAVKRYGVEVLPQGASDMVITPDANAGNFFNRQTRNSTTLQWVESLTMASAAIKGEHLFKLGSDVLIVGYDGTSDSHPVNVLRENGTLVERIAFAPSTRQHVTSAEAALLAQDHWRINDRVMVEFGGRVDRDGVLDRTNVTPRGGGAISLLPDARMVVRGGLGLFYDRTPLIVGAFESFGSRTIARYAADGVTPVGPSLTYVNRMDAGMRTPYSRIWNVELDERVTDQWSFKINHMHRVGHNEFIVEPVLGPSGPHIRLSSTGESRYMETEFTIRLDVPDRAETTVSYVRSSAMADLNSYDLYFGNTRDPLIRPNQYGRAPVDAPNRVVIRGSYHLPWKISFEPLFDLRDGFPLSTLAEDQSYLGPRNGAGRYPFFKSFDFSASRPVKIWKYKATVGIRMFNTLAWVNPTMAQRNVASPSFGGMYTTVPRDFQTFIELTK